MSKPIATTAKNNVVTMPVKKAVAQAIDNLTDVWNSERFANKFQGAVAFVPQRGQWLEFYDHCWRIDEMRNVMNRSIELTKEMILEASTMLIRAHGLSDNNARKVAVEEASDLSSHAVKTQSKAKLESILSLASAHPMISHSQADLDKNDNHFGVQNGVLELDSGIFREGVPADYITRQSRAEWLGGDEDVGCPNWEKFLSDVQPDQDVRHWLQKFAGYMLTGHADEQIFTVFQGNGANGKSVFVEVMKMVLGGYAKTVQFDTFTENDKSAIRNDLAALDKIRLVVAQEGPEGARLDEGIVKQLTGQDEVTARFLHREFFTYKPKFKIVLVTNHKPVISGSDNGIWRRVVLVPWPVTISEEMRDKRLQDKLADELPGILAWAMKGYHMWREQGLSDLPLAIKLANSEYRKDSDLIGMWLSDCCVVDDHASVSSAELYSSYDRWARDGGFRPVSQKTLGDKLREKGFFPVKSGGVRRWKGLRINFR